MGGIAAVHHYHSQNHSANHPSCGRNTRRNTPVNNAKSDKSDKSNESDGNDGYARIIDMASGPSKHCPSEMRDRDCNAADETDADRDASRADRA